MQTLRQTKKLFRQTFEASTRLEFQKVSDLFANKSWIFFCLNMGSRIMNTATGSTTWQKAFKIWHEEPLQRSKFNAEFVEESEPYVKVAIFTLLAVGFLLGVLVWRRRKFASLLLYYELVFILVNCLAPLDYGDFGGMT